MSGYNGWSNYETLNVALWIGNDEGLYSLARDCRGYGDFAHVVLGCAFLTTPDGVSYEDDKLNTAELDDLIKEFAAE